MNFHNIVNVNGSEMILQETAPYERLYSTHSSEVLQKTLRVTYRAGAAKHYMSVVLSVFDDVPESRYSASSTMVVDPWCPDPITPREMFGVLVSRVENQEKRAGL